jgi:antitoxin ParD1/3/4
MAEGLNVRLPEKLRAFVEERADGLYGSSSEYIRELIRRDFEREESRRWAWLENELAPAMKAGESAFAAVSADDVIKRNRP